MTSEVDSFPKISGQACVMLLKVLIVLSLASLLLSLALAHPLAHLTKTP